MKRLSLFFLCLMMLFNNIKEVKAYNEYYAKSYIVLEKESKRILEGKDYYNTQSVASISKLMTFYVAHKYMDLDHVVTVGEEIHTIVGSAVYLEVGEQITLYELLVSLNHGVWFNKNKLMKQYKNTTSCKKVLLHFYARYIMRLNTTK